MKEIIDNIQNERNIFANAIIILVVALMIVVSYNFKNFLDYLVTVVPQIMGGLAFVAFCTALLKFLSSLDYFNNLIFYKQALSAL